MLNRQTLFHLLLLIPILINAQKKISIVKISDEIKVDGIMNESIWEKSNKATNFLNQWPKDAGFAKLPTEVSMLYNETYIYVGVKCFDTSSYHIVQTLKRDKDDEHFGSDGIAIVLDPFNQKTNGFFFGVNAGGAQFEGLISVSGNESFINENWDNKWISKVTFGDQAWYVEMAIPFRTLRYDKESKSWGLNFVRNDMKNNYFYSWNHVPLNLNTINLGYTGELLWEDNPPNIENEKVTLTPYFLGSFNKDYKGKEKADYNFNAGLDAKIAVSPSLNLDLTINPDFSTVDVDRQQTNLTRFPLFFPERRGFFLENSDLFSSFGSSSINPFFSRRIGLNVPIRFGVRLTGNLNEKLRIGVLDVQTGKEEGINTQNYFVTSLSHKIGNRSTLDAMLVNRQATSFDENPLERAYNRVLALEYNFIEKEGKWSANAGVHKSFNPGELDEEIFLTTSLKYQNKQLLTSFSGHRVGQNYLTDVGFVPRLENFNASLDKTVRKGFYQFRYLLVYNFLPQKESSIFNLHGPRISSTSILNNDGSLNALFAGMFYYVNFKNQSALELKLTHDKDNLPFDSFIIGNIPFPKDEYNYNRYGFWYNLDPRKKLSGRLGATFGNFYKGKRTFFEASLSYRIQPWGNFSLNYGYNKINLPENLSSQDLYLAGLTSEISFSNKMFWTTFIQYNSQIDNINLNSRFQWRYSPMSDLFIVYSDNYVPENIQIKNRGLVIKVTHWF